MGLNEGVDRGHRFGERTTAADDQVERDPGRSQGAVRRLSLVGRIEISVAYLVDAKIGQICNDVAGIRVSAVGVLYVYIYTNTSEKLRRAYGLSAHATQVSGRA